MCNRTVGMRYDADGEITSIGDNFSHYAYTYDGQGHLASADNKGTPGVPDVVLVSQYDPAGNRSSLSATIGGTKDFLNSYSYDTLSRLVTMQQVQQNGGNVVDSKEIDYGYDAIGDVIDRVAFNFVGVGPRYDIATSAMTYNPLGLLTGISMTSDGGQVSLDHLTYSYDTLARVSTFGSVDGTATYGYDKTSQLISASYVAASGHTEPANFSIAFDPNGNRSTVNGQSTTISPNNEVTNDGTFTYQFDAEGNRTVRTRISTAYATDYKTTYSWDYRNRLTDVENFDNNGVLTQHVHYVYDVWDHLIERELDPNGSGTYTSDTHYVWDASAPPTLGAAGQPPNAPGNIVLAFNGSEQLTTRYLVGPNTSAYDPYLTTLAEEDVTSTSQGGTLTFDLPDKQGSLVDVADDSGNLANHVEYTPFGQVFNETSPSVPHIAGFAGGIYDAATCLINNLERWYDPLATVWLSADPTGFRAGDSNLVRAVSNDPTNFVDPSGEAIIVRIKPQPRPGWWPSWLPWNSTPDPSDFVCPLGMAKVPVQAGLKAMAPKAKQLATRAATVCMKYVDDVSKVALRGKSLPSGTKALKSAGLLARRTAKGVWEFFDSCGHVRARWIPRTGKEPAHWHKFGPGGAGAGKQLNNAGRAVTTTHKGHRIPSNGGSPKGGGGPGSPSPL